MVWGCAASKNIRCQWFQSQVFMQNLAVSSNSSYALTECCGCQASQWSFQRAEEVQQTWSKDVDMENGR